MPVVGTRGNASAFGYGWSAGASEVLGGMVLVAPTSVVAEGTGATATINGNGSVTFTDCTALSLNGIFTASYDNYQVIVRWQYSTGAGTALIYGRLRNGGTDETSTANYNSQTLRASSTNITSARGSADGFWYLSSHDSVNINGLELNLFGPYLSQATAFRSISVSSNGPEIYDVAGTHEPSSSYDGFTIDPAANKISGLISVYGLAGA